MTNEAILPQNKAVTIVPSGIKRHQHDINCEDAACEEIINMRYKNGAWKTVGEKEQFWQYDHQCSQIYYHPERNASGTNIYVGYLASDHSIYSINATAGTKTIIFPLAATETFSQFASLNSVLIIYTDKTVYFYHWNDDVNGYVALSQDIIPQVYFHYYQVDGFTVPPTGTTEEEDLFQTQKELFDAILIARHKIRQKGFYSHAYITMQWAYRMWNGAYIMHSQPYLLKLTDEEAYFTQVISDTPTEEVYGCSMHYGRPVAYINFGYNVVNNLAKYRGLITHLCLFMSQDVSQYLYEVNPTPYYEPSSGVRKFAFSNNTESLDQLMKMYPLYLAKEIPLNDVLAATDTTRFEINLTEATNKVNYNGDGGDSIDTVEKIPVRHNTYSWKKFGNWVANVANWMFGDNTKPNKQVWYTSDDAEQTTESTDDAGAYAIQSQPELPVDEFTHHLLIPTAVPYVFNGKLHIGDINVKFWGGDDYTRWLKYDSRNINTPISGYTFYREVTLETDKGTRYVVETFDPYYSPAGGSIYLFYVPNVISYPDIRATKIRIVYLKGGKYREFISYELQSHKMYNFAYCVTNKEFLTDDTEYLSYSDDELTLDTLHPEYNAKTALATDSRYYRDTNRVQVSALNNALFYPAMYSYQIGNSANDIRCFASQSAPLSAGQFGQYPLTVFTSQGTFVMRQGDGQVIYSAVIPLNNEVAYKHSVCELGGAIVYAATNGIRLLSGNEVQHLSRDLEGEPSRKLVDDSYYINFINNISNELVYLYQSLSAEDFLDYLDDNVRIVYDNINKELIISNRDLLNMESRLYQSPYSYVYNLEAKTWHKITDSWHDFMLINSKWYGVRNFRTGGFTGHGMWSMTDENEVVIDCMMQSRPMKLGSFNFKKVKEVVQRSLCYVGDPIDSDQSDDRKFGMYLFGSLENNYYKFIKGIKVSQTFGMVQYPSLPAVHQSLHHVILLTAVRSKDFVLSHWELLREDTQVGKLGAEARRNIESIQGDYNSQDYNNSDYNA